MDVHQGKVFRKNYIVNVLDGGFFGFAFGFASFTTVIPLFVSTMTSSAILIGLIPAIHSMGWQLPQLLTARRVARLDHIKPMVMFYTIQERLPFLGLAAVAWFLPAIGLKLGLALTFLFLIWQGLGGGFAANPWITMIGKIIPDDYRATFFGIQSAAASLLASLGAVTAGFLLESNESSRGYALCFLAASGLLVVSGLSLNMTEETKRNPEDYIDEGIPLWTSIRNILKENIPFRWFLVTRMASQFCLMASAFYTVYAVRYHGMNELTAGYLTSTLLITQVITNPITGWIADRWNRRSALQIGAVAGTLSALLAIFAPNLAWFFPVVILAGIASTVFFTIGLAMTLEFGTDNDRPTYIGMANTLVAPSTILAPLLGGWLADAAGFPVTFAVAAFAGLWTVILLQFFVRRRVVKTD